MKTEILAEELLLLFCHGFDLLAMPSVRKWNQSGEGWLYQNGLLQRLHYLEKQRWIAREKSHTRGDWIWRLTSVGRSHVRGGRDPEVRWRRTWDGWWRQLVFDLPVGRQHIRTKLIRWLRRNGFGYLQDSVWIGVDPVSELKTDLRALSKDVESFTIFECRCAPGFTDSALVKGAWPFTEINKGYAEYVEFAAEASRRICHEKPHPRDLFATLKEERRRWSAAFDLDPLLPETLWPNAYQGRRAWQAQLALLRQVGAQIHSSAS